MEVREKGGMEGGREGGKGGGGGRDGGCSARRGVREK